MDMMAKKQIPCGNIFFAPAFFSGSQPRQTRMQRFFCSIALRTGVTNQPG